MRVEDLDSWTGQDVVDADDHKIGKLHDVYTEIGRDDPAIGAVKVGRIAGRLHLVPLGDAVFSRGQIRVPLAKDHVAGAPEVGDTGRLSRAEEIAFAQHYGLDDPGSSDRDDALRYESTAARRARGEAMGRDLARAEEMEAEAETLGGRAVERDAQAAELAQHAAADRGRQQQLLDEAAAIRRGLDAAPPV